jgi:hypothetical protein
MDGLFKVARPINCSLYDYIAEVILAKTRTIETNCPVQGTPEV